MSSPGWQRLSPRMLLVHPLHEVLRELPLLIAVVVFGSATDNSLEGNLEREKFRAQFIRSQTGLGVEQGRAH